MERKEASREGDTRINKEGSDKKRLHTMVTSSPCTLTSGLRNARIAVVAASMAASTMLPQLSRMVMSTRTDQTCK